MTVTHDDVTVEWLGYATLRVADADEETVVYVDPGRYGVLTGEWTPDTPGVSHPPAADYRPGDADVVCVTHDHHYDPDGIRRVAGEDATLVVFDGVNTHHIDRVDDRPSDLGLDVKRVDAHADFAIGDAILRTIPAYNTPDGHTRPNGDPYHPEGRGCGFLVTLADATVFWPGDTDVLDGHAELDVDVFCPPIGGSFTMDRHDAADLADAMAPDVVLPIHYNTFAALETDSTAFAEDLDDRGVSVALDEN